VPVFAERMGVERVLVPPMMAASREGGWGAVRAELEAMGVAIEPIAAGDRFRFGRGRVEVLWPPREPSPRLMGNDGSVVARFTRATEGGPATVLMTGDVQRAGIAGLMAAGADLRASVVEVPHHGSADEAAMELVASSGAVVALQSSGPSRLNDDRWAGVRARVPFLSTADAGAVWVLITDGFTYETGSMVPPGGPP
jgi:beta-lactamase superfamily II metal-dependent hydrolase